MPLPTAKTPPKPSLSDLSVLIYGATKIGKCLKGDTAITDPDTGQSQTIRELVQSRTGLVQTLSVSGITRVQPSAFACNEPAQLYRLTSESGRSIEATAQHPFLTRTGWKALSELTDDDRIAVVREYPPEEVGAGSDGGQPTTALYLHPDGWLQILRARPQSGSAAATTVECVGRILFESVRSIEATTVEPVYDLTIPGTHNFIANDFVVHNSTWCSHAEGALFLSTEPGLNSLEVYQVPIASWEELLAACKEIAAGEHPFHTVVIDTVDNAFRMCADYVCRKHKVEHEADLNYGKGYSLISGEFQRVLNKLAFMPYGLVLISHSQNVEIETRTGKYTKTVPTLPEKARKIVLGLVDMILYCDMETGAGPDGRLTARRVMRTKPSMHYEAGDRTGRLPETIDLDYAKFIEAFNADSKEIRK